MFYLLELLADSRCCLEILCPAIELSFFGGVKYGLLSGLCMYVQYVMWMSLSGYWVSMDPVLLGSHWQLFCGGM